MTDTTISDAAIDAANACCELIESRYGERVRISMDAFRDKIAPFFTTAAESARAEGASKGFLRCVAEIREQARRRQATAYELNGEDRRVPIEVARELTHLADWLERNVAALIKALRVEVGK